jgi:acyl transferase domain-containing protein
MASTLAASSIGPALKFDAALLGVSSHETVQADTRQRFLMVMTWVASEDAGIKAA